MRTSELGNLIKKAQGNRTQNQYALHSGVSSAAIGRYIDGTRNPTPEALKKLASRAYGGVTYEMLMQVAGYLDIDINNLPKNYITFARFKEIAEERGFPEQDFENISDEQWASIVEIIKNFKK